MDQPGNPNPNEGSKKCYSCPTSTPYSQGFCGDCWASLPLGVQLVYLNAAELIEPFGGLVRQAIAQGVHFARARTRTPTRVTLEDLDL
jgi:hypothetical protein